MINILLNVLSGFFFIYEYLKKLEVKTSVTFESAQHKIFFSEMFNNCDK